MKTILVTGGVGFIGSNFCKLLLKIRPTWKIINVDCVTKYCNESTINKELKNSKYIFYKCDILDKNSIFNIFQKEKPEIVVNFAAESHVDRSIDNSDIFFKTNVLGTLVLLEACKKYGIERFHQVSTDEVYGDLQFDSKDMFDEKSKLNPSSPYASSKASADLLALSFYRTFGIPITISRCSNNYGPYQFPEKLIPSIIFHALKNEKISIYGNGKNIRDWIFVEDHCLGILKVLEHGLPGEIYNLSSNYEIDNLSLAKKILHSLNKSESLIVFTEDRKGHDLKYSLNSSKAKSVLQWNPVTCFEKGLIATIEWYKENIQWLNDCL